MSAEAFPDEESDHFEGPEKVLEVWYVIFYCYFCFILKCTSDLVQMFCTLL
jgi:hypothetical protein